MTAAAHAPGTHAVKFYDGDPWLYQAVFDFVAGALRRGSPALMIARRGTYEAILDRLRSGFDPALAAAASRLYFVDAEAALDRFLIGGRPNAIRFVQLFDEVIATVRHGGTAGPIWIYGEMVDVLCRRGRYDAVLELETLWNRMMTPAFVVLCGYAVASFDDDRQGQRYRAICDAHTHVMAADRRASRAAPPVAAPPVSVSVVYVIDDDASMRRSLTRLLESVDLNVRTFPSAEAFLDEVDRTADGCLILDIQLTGMSGIDLQALMTAEGWRLPVVAMSGLHDDRMEGEALRQGARAFLHKPFDAEALFAAITRAQR